MMIRRCARTVKRTVLIATILAAATSASFAAEAKRQFDMAAGSAPQTLNEFSRQANIQLLFDADAVRTLQTRAISGEMEIGDALSQLLDGTGLVFEFVNERTVAVTRQGALRPTTQRTSGEPQGVGTRVPASLDQAARDTGELETIVVTAQKRSQALQDVPVPVTAIATDALISNNQTQLEDYYTGVPGLSVSTASFGSPQLAIRGITTGGDTNPSVGIVVDDVPYGSTTILGGGFLAPNFDPADLARIEVLRGPQGTLYGASSIGGLIKYVTLDPTTDGLNGQLQTGASTVEGGDDLGYNVRGAINVPLGETVAMRASAFTRHDPGYIDTTQTNEDDINSSVVSGGRVSALWRQSDALTIKLSAQIQETQADGSPFVERRLGDLKQNDLPGTGHFDGRMQAYSATVLARLGSVDVTSLTGYNINKIDSLYDNPRAAGAATLLFGPGNGIRQVNDNETTKFTQEVRLTTSLGASTEWLFGAFYTNEDSDFTQELIAANRATGDAVASMVVAGNPTEYSEYAAFTSFTFHVTDRFDLQVGGRASENRQKASFIWSGPFVPAFLNNPSPLLPPAQTLEDRSFTYLVTPQYRFSADWMAYARFASGYRPGGINVNNSLNPLPTFEPDTTDNYEVGVKGNLFGNTLYVDASVYYIDWQDIQLQVIDPITATALYGNASRARSQGVELSVEARPLRGMTIAGWVAWGDAELSEDLPRPGPQVGFSGDRLPYTSRLSGSVSLDQSFALDGGRVTAFVGGSVSYVGDRAGIFTSSARREQYPSYTRVDLRAGLNLATWSVNLSANNVGDERGVLAGGFGTSRPNGYTYIRPRTLSLNVTKDF